MSRARTSRPSNPLPSIPLAIAVLITALLAFVASTRLLQSDGDLFAHIAFGRKILGAGAIPRLGVVGFADAPPAFVAPAWGAATIFALLERFGGLALIAACVALLAGATHGAIALWLRRRGAVAGHVVLSSLFAFVLASSHWLARPHAFSLAGAAALLLLLESHDQRALLAVPPLFAVWCNLHGGWVFGLIVVGCYAVGSSLDAVTPAARSARSVRSEPLHYSLVFVLSAAATLINPYGIHLHGAVWKSLADPSVAAVINEYQPPSFRSPSDLFFFFVSAASLALMVRERRLPSWRWTLVIAVCSLFALRAGRNISLFGVTAWPLIALHLSPAATRWLRGSGVAGDLARYDATHSPTLWGVGVVALVLALGVSGGRLGSVQLIANRVDPRRFPVDAIEDLRTQPSSSRLLTTWTWSGYVAYAAPGRRTYFDPLAFSAETLRAFGTVLLARPHWEATLDSLRIDFVLAPMDLPLADSLLASSQWDARWRGRTATLFVRAVTNVRGVSAK